MSCRQARTHAHTRTHTSDKLCAGEFVVVGISEFVRYVRGLVRAHPSARRSCRVVCLMCVRPQECQPCRIMTYKQAKWFAVLNGFDNMSGNIDIGGI